MKHKKIFAILPLCTLMAAIYPAASSAGTPVLVERYKPATMGNPPPTEPGPLPGGYYDNEVSAYNAYLTAYFKHERETNAINAPYYARTTFRNFRANDVGNTYTWGKATNWVSDATIETFDRYNEHVTREVSGVGYSSL